MVSAAPRALNPGLEGIARPSDLIRWLTRQPGSLEGVVSLKVTFLPHGPGLKPPN